MDGTHSHQDCSEVREEGPPCEDDDTALGGVPGPATMTTTTMTHESSHAWEQWLETITTGSEEDRQRQHEATVPSNLEAYLMAKQIRHDAKQAFEDAMEESLSGLNHAMTVDLIQDTVGVVDQQQSERLDQLETNILLTLQSNHERRDYLLLELEQINRRWGRQYKKMRQGILNEPEGSPDHQEEKTDRKDHHPSVAKQGNKQQVRRLVSSSNGFIPTRLTHLFFLPTARRSEVVRGGP